MDSSGSESLTPDGKLAVAIMDGCREAEAKLWPRYARGIRAVLWSSCRDEDLILDLRQQTMVAVIVALREKRLKNPNGLSAFVIRTAKNILSAHFRVEMRRRTDCDTEAVETQPYLGESAADEYLRRQRAWLVRQYLGELRQERDRELLTRYYLLGQEKADICAALELTAKHFDRVLFRAKGRLRDLADECAALDESAAGKALQRRYSKCENGKEREVLRRFHEWAHPKERVCSEMGMSPEEFDELIQRTERANGEEAEE